MDQQQQTLKRQTPFRRAMIGGRTMWGVDYQLAVLNMMFAVMFVAVGHMFWWIIVSLLIHKLLRMAYSSDPQLFKVYMRYVKQGHSYDPWSQARNRNPRPGGWQ